MKTNSLLELSEDYKSNSGDLSRIAIGCTRLANERVTDFCGRRIQAETTGYSLQNSLQTTIAAVILGCMGVGLLVWEVLFAVTRIAIHFGELIH